MSTFISMILCLAMLLGADSVPAVPESTLRITVSDMTLSVGEESVTLTPSAEMLLGLGTERIDGGFALILNDEKLFETDGQLTNDAARFMLRGADHAYYVNDQAYLDLLGTPLEQKIWLSLADIFDDFGTLIMLKHDEAQSAQLKKAFTDAETSLMQREATRIDYDGRTYEGTHYSWDYTVQDVYDLYETLSKTCDTRIGKVFNDIRAMQDVLLADGDNTERLQKALDAESHMDMTVFNEDGIEYTSTYVKSDTSTADTVYVVDNDAMKMISTVRSEGTVPVNIDLFLDSTPEGAYMFSMNLNNMFTVTANGETTQAHTTFNTAVTVSEIADFILICSGEVIPDTDGGKHMNCTLSSPSIGASLSCSLKTETVPALDAFECVEMYDLNNDDLFEKNQKIPDSDILHLSTDVLKLQQDNSLEKAGELLEKLGTIKDAVTGEEEYYGTYRPVSSLEEAASVFSGVIPPFTVPEGYSFDEIMVGSMEADMQLTKDDSRIGISFIRQNDNGQKYGFIEADGTVSEIVRPVATCYQDEDGSIRNIFFSLPSGVNVYIEFTAVDPVDTQALLAEMINE